MAPAGTLIYDGGCGFCSRCARWVERRWPADSARAIAWQDLPPEELVRFGLSPNDVASRAWWVDAAGSSGGAAAVGAALRTTTGGWHLVGSLLNVAPIRWGTEPAYRFVARYRHLLPGSTEECRVQV